MKIVYQNSFDKHTDVFVGEIASFEKDYLAQHGFTFSPGTGKLKKQVQSYFVRKLLADCLGINIFQIKKKDRIPYVDGIDEYFSLSHAGDKVAVIIGNKRVGVDIELETDKILNIKHKFVNQQEDLFIPEDKIMEGASIVWGAKESMFKLYQKGALSYLNHLQLHPFNDFDSDKFECFIEKNEKINCIGQHQKLGDYRLVGVWES